MKLDDRPANASRAAVATHTDTTSTATTSAIPVSRDDPQIRLHGSIVVSDENGIEHSTQDGTLVLELRQGSETLSLQTPVSAGRWSIDAPSCDQARVMSATLGGRRAAADATYSFTPIPADRNLDLRVHWLYGPLLHVRDAHTRQELTQVVVECGLGLSRANSQDCARPAGMVLSSASGPSPLAILPEELARSAFAGTETFITVRVRVPDYAWGFAQIDLTRSSEVFVDLLPAAGLDVDVIGDASALSANLRVRSRVERAIILDEALAGRTQVAIDGLSPGRFTVSVEFGPAWENPQVLTSAEVELIAATRVHLQLQPTASPPVQRADMSGELWIPREWNVDPSTLIARLDDKHVPEDDRSLWLSLRASKQTPTFDTFQWEARRAIVGHYEFTLHSPELPFVASAELGVEGLKGVRFEVAPPTTVRVSWVDAERGDPLRPELVLWSPRNFRGPWTGACSQAEFDPRINAFEFRAPVGTIHVLAGALPSGYLRSDETAVLVPGVNEFRWKLQRAHGIVIRLMDGERPVTARQVATFELEPFESSGKQVDQYFGERETYLAVSSAGRHRLKIVHELQGFLPVPDRIVDIAPGRMTPVEIALVREP
ncbi:MAG: hypothetical protein JNL28_06575 [Planctomycetes bacterium]|nr:hypothetical protein [Planctomycetota bacterium]